QAEDGIRDRNVTGVQTCALPILDRNRISPKPTPAAQAAAAGIMTTADSPKIPAAVAVAPKTRNAPRRPTVPNVAVVRAATRAPRSEERRVGKERRSGWWPGGSNK